MQAFAGDTAWQALHISVHQPANGTRRSRAAPTNRQQSGEPPSPEQRDSTASELPLAGCSDLGHIGLIGDVAEWLKAAVC